MEQNRYDECLADLSAISSLKELEALAALAAEDHGSYGPNLSFAIYAGDNDIPVGGPLFATCEFASAFSLCKALVTTSQALWDLAEDDGHPAFGGCTGLMLCIKATLNGGEIFGEWMVYTQAGTPQGRQVWLAESL